VAQPQKRFVMSKADEIMKEMFPTEAESPNESNTTQIETKSPTETESPAETDAPSPVETVEETPTAVETESPEETPAAETGSDPTVETESPVEEDAATQPSVNPHQLDKGLQKLQQKLAAVEKMIMGLKTEKPPVDDKEDEKVETAESLLEEIKKIAQDDYSIDPYEGVKKLAVAATRLIEESANTRKAATEEVRYNKFWEGFDAKYPQLKNNSRKEWENLLAEGSKHGYSGEGLRVYAQIKFDERLATLAEGTKKPELKKIAAKKPPTPVNNGGKTTTKVAATTRRGVENMFDDLKLLDNN
jgi:hypothetical protein